MTVFLAILAALPALIQALPYVMQVTLKLITIMEKFISWAQRKEVLTILNEIEATIDKLDEAKTPEEKKAAAHAIADLIRRFN